MKSHAGAACIHREHETGSLVSQMFKYGGKYADRLLIVGKLHQNVTEGYDRLCQVNIARTGFASDEIATRTLDLDTRRLTPDPEGTFA